MQNKKLIHVVIILFMLLSLLPITPKQAKAASLNQIFLGEPQAVFSGRTISSGKKVVAIGKDSDGTLHMAGMVGLTPFTLSDLKGVPAYQLHNGSRELN